MKKLGFAVVFSIGCVAGCSVSADRDDVKVKPDVNAATPEAQSPGSPAKHRIVVFKSDTAPQDAGARIVKAGGALVRSLDAIGVAIASGNAAFDAAIAKDPTVLAVGDENTWKNPHSTVQLSFPDQIGWPLQWDIRRVNAPQAWNNVTREQQANVTVAVIDVGIAYNHPDLQNVVDGQTFALCPGDAPPGYPAYTSTFNVYTGQCDQSPVSFEFHGTHVAGTIAGQEGGGLIVGVAPAAHLAAYRVFDHFNVPDPNEGTPYSAGATDGAIQAAIIDASNKHYGVINMSLGGRIDRSNKAQNAAWLAWNRVARYATTKGTLIVAAAGNDATSSNGTTAVVPSDLPNVLSVSATATSASFGTLDSWFQSGMPELDVPAGTDVLAEYSNTGASVDVAAPGGNCGPNMDCNATFLNLVLSSVITPDGNLDWGWAAGTSMASPHVAGVAALVRAKHPELGPLDVRSRIKNTAQPLPSSTHAFGAGLVDAAAATSL